MINGLSSIIQSVRQESFMTPAKQLESIRAATVLEGSENRISIVDIGSKYPLNLPIH